MSFDDDWNNGQRAFEFDGGGPKLYTAAVCLGMLWLALGSAIV